jgi:hypothetical protein
MLMLDNNLLYAVMVPHALCPEWSRQRAEKNDIILCDVSVAFVGCIPVSYVSCAALLVRASVAIY